MHAERTFASGTLIALISVFSLVVRWRQKNAPRELGAIAFIGVCLSVFVVMQGVGGLSVFHGNVLRESIIEISLYSSTIGLFSLISYVFLGSLHIYIKAIMAMLGILICVVILGDSDHRVWALRIFHVGAIVSAVLICVLLISEMRQRSRYKVLLGCAMGIFTLGGLLDVLIIRGVISLPRTIDIIALAFILGLLLIVLRKNLRVSKGGHTADYIADDMTHISRLHVMAIDDSSLQLDLIEAMLAPHLVGYTLCASGNEAIKSFGDHVDVVVCDYHMPDMNGDQVIKELFSRKNTLILIGLTGDNTDQTMSKFSRAGCHEVLVKPVTREELLGAIDRSCFR
jgi:CheY-like chemotaxis protein